MYQHLYTPLFNFFTTFKMQPQITNLHLIHSPPCCKLTLVIDMKVFTQFYLRLLVCLYIYSAIYIHIHMYILNLTCSLDIFMLHIPKNNLKREEKFHRNEHYLVRDLWICEAHYIVHFSSRSKNKMLMSHW